jgi:hypothetical protein
MEIKCTSDNSIDFYWTIRRYISEDRNLHSHQEVEFTPLHLARKTWRHCRY